MERLLTALALFAMPNARRLWAASLVLWLLTASINVAMEPFRALVADNLPRSSGPRALPSQVFFIGAGAVFASALPWMLTHWFGVSGHARSRAMLPQSVSSTFYIGAVCLIAAVLWTVITTPSRRPIASPPMRPSRSGMRRRPQQGAHVADAKRPAVDRRRDRDRWLGLRRAGSSAKFMCSRRSPLPSGCRSSRRSWLRRSGRDLARHARDRRGHLAHARACCARLAIVQFFTWFGLFAMWIYAIPAVAARHLRHHRRGARPPITKAPIGSACCSPAITASPRCGAAAAARSRADRAARRRMRSA